MLRLGELERIAVFREKEKRREEFKKAAINASDE